MTTSLTSCTTTCSAEESSPCGDTGEEHYRDAVARFKAKWMHRTPRNRVEFYEKKIQAYADKCKVELGIKEFEEGE